ncbi:hypothetical protein ABZ215_38515 [Amycolatopsis sp. NPDC006131]|uniref:hypothetical protein n=1 Tax=Amycolatopsis sp. NPDC006131 TaxID=3156731 RepID=UPI0033A8BB95
MIVLAVIAMIGTVVTAVVPKWIEHRRKPDPPPPPATPTAATETAVSAPAKADSGWSIVQDAMDDLQHQRDLLQMRLDERDAELRRANKRIASLEAQLRGRGNA